MATIADVEDDYGAGGGSASVQRDGGPERVADVDMEEEVPEGVIYPPREIRAVVDKTAQFVARSGPQFEERIRENERANPKFSFLNPRDPFHAYYLYKIRLTREGRGGDAALGDTPAQRPGGAAQKEKPVPKEPPAFEFSIDLPPISAQDLWAYPGVLLWTSFF